MSIMKTSNLLAQAKQYLWDGVSHQADNRTSICSAITNAFFLSNAHLDGANRSMLECVRQDIERRLHPYVYLHSWVAITVYGGSHPDLTDENVQRHRHQWLDMLIAEYEAKGD